MKESPHEPLTVEQDKRETVICIVWASVVVFGMLALFLHGMAFLSWTELTMEEIYARRRMESGIKIIQNQIEDLYQWRTSMVVEYGRDKLKYENYIHHNSQENMDTYLRKDFENHKHHFWTGKVK